MEIRASRRNFLVGAGASLASFLFPSLGFAETPKQKCTQAGQKLLYKGTNYICVKSGNKLSWQTLTPARPPVVVHTPSTVATPAPSTATKVTGYMVGMLSSLNENEPKIVTGKNTDGRTENFVLALSGGKVSAHSVVCTHAGCAVVTESSGANVICRCHNSIFNGVTGAVVKGPARDPLLEYKVAQVGGEIYIVGA